MIAECIPHSRIPGTSRLFIDFAEGKPELLERFYPGNAGGQQWWKTALPEHHAPAAAVADLLEGQNRAWDAGEATLANIARLRAGARAVVTGQQVTLFGGPLLTLLKAATAVARAREATAAGVEAVPVFWMATEDHDFAEANGATFPAPDGSKDDLRTLRIAGHPLGQVEVGSWIPDDSLARCVANAAELLSAAASGEWAAELLRESYAPGRSMAEMFAHLMLRLFRDEGLVLLDASGRDAHALAAPVLQAAIDRAGELHAALEARDFELAKAGYHSQVLVAHDSSLLFLLRNGVRTPLKLEADGSLRAPGKSPQEDLAGVLRDAPERLSPNALLRPVMQDYLLPTLAYIAGPAEIAYFAQTNVLYKAILGRATPVLPRLSATLVSARVLRVLKRHGLEVEDTWRPADELALRLGARAIPVEAKKQLSATGNALDAELTTLIAHATQSGEALGHAANVAANKMRYQMNRLRRLLARHEEEREPALEKRARLLTTTLYPQGHLQERVLGGVWFVAEAGEAFVSTLVDAAAESCNGHAVSYLS